eukprot:8898334-Lingulodinium_polyedra.AAC.1
MAARRPLGATAGPGRGPHSAGDVGSRAPHGRGLRGPRPARPAQEGQRLGGRRRNWACGGSRRAPR